MSFVDIKSRVKNELLAKWAQAFFIRILKDSDVDELTLDYVNTPVGEVVSLNLVVGGHQYQIQIQDRGEHLK